MAADKEKPRILKEIREVKPKEKGPNIALGEDFSDLNAMLVQIAKQKEVKKKK